MDRQSLGTRIRNWDFFNARRIQENAVLMGQRAQLEEPLRDGLMRQIRKLWTVLLVLDAVLLWRAGATWLELGGMVGFPALWLLASLHPVKPVARAMLFAGIALAVTLPQDRFAYPQGGAVLVLTIILAGLLVGEFFVGVWAVVCCGALSVGLSHGQPWQTTAGWAITYAVAGWLVILFSRHLERSLGATIGAEQQQRDAIVAERTRFAREIHDTLAQGFTGIMMQLNAASQRLGSDDAQAHEHIDKARVLAQTSLDEARRSVSALRMGVLTNSTLFEALQQLAKELAADSKLRIEPRLEGVPQALPEGVESNLLRIGQEAMTNALRHSGADRIDIRLAYAPGCVVLEVEDNGRGGAESSASSFGVEGMRERSRQVGAQIDIRSQPGRGTRVVIIVPNA